ncbi:MAG: baseplate J/gp47 family protein [Deltaproteobacteria bacterium]|nr:baseplate J/gp47 family protein [Deltaproteobacteria bacterium]
MDDSQVEILLNEIGVPSEDWMSTEMETQAAGTPVEWLIESLSSAVTWVFYHLFDQAWRMIRGILASLIPMIFIRHATGHWLDEHAEDHGLARDIGLKTLLPLTLGKDAGSDLVVPIGTVFFTKGSNSKRFKTLVEVTGSSAATSFNVQIEAVCPVDVDANGITTAIYSAAYNVVGGTLFDCEDTNLPITSFTYTGPPDQSGEDPETDDNLRARIFALKALKNLDPIQELFLINLFTSVTGVTGATLDSIDPNTAMMDFTLYGSTGTIDQPTLDAAQAEFDANGHLTDHVTLSGAQPQPITLTLLHADGGIDADIQSKAGDFFNGLANGNREGLPRGANFESSDLHDYLQETWPDLRTRITPQNDTLVTGYFFAPTINPGVLP